MSKHRIVHIAELDRVGTGLHRPECVLADPSGDVFVPDWRGGVTRIAADGFQQTWFARQPAITLRPNGIARAKDDSFLVANLDEAGGVWRLHQDGSLEPFVTEVDGVSLPPANFVLVDRLQRTWISVSTRQVPRQQAWRAGFGDGFIVLADRAGVRIVADGLHYTNEVRPDPSGEWLYVVETFGKRLSRFRIGSGGELRRRETVATFGAGCFPDGFAFDAAGGIWIASLISNRLLRLAGDTLQTVLEDMDAAQVKAVEDSFAAGRMNAEDLGPIPGTTLQQLTSVAFGGADRQTIYLGSLHGTCVYRFHAGVRGAV